MKEELWDTHITTPWGSPREDLKVLEIAADVKSIIMASEIKIGDWTGKPGSKPELGPDEINFNAMRPQDYENFRYPPQFEQNHRTGIEEGFSFCKTARKPYDPVVCATLIAIKHHLGEYVSVNSDGDFDNPNEWGPAYELYARALGRELPPFFRQFADKLSSAEAPPSLQRLTLLSPTDNGNCGYCGGRPGSQPA